MSNKGVDSVKDPSKVKPFVSLLLFKEKSVQRSAKQRAASADDVLKAIIKQLRVRFAARQSDSKITVSSKGHSSGNDLALRRFKIQTPPGWLGRGNGNVRNIEHHLLALCMTDSNPKTYALYSSSREIAAVADRLLEEGNLAKSLKLEPVESEALEKAFLAGAAKSIWLSGGHKRTSIKADSKLLTGIDVRDALDPVGDQSYAYTAARGETTFNGRKRIVGVSPERSRVWVGSSKHL
ncbi:hypothetical protein, partial [Leucobacter sp. BZR 635]